MAYKLGYEVFNNGYQPKKINGKTLKETGQTVGNTPLKGSTSWNGKNMDSQNIWTDGTNKWIWVRTDEGRGYYVMYNKNLASKTGAVNFSDTNSSCYKKYIKSTKTTNMNLVPGTSASFPSTTPTKSSSGGGTNSSGSGSGGGGFRGSTPTSTNTKTNTNAGGGNNYTPSVDPGLYDLINDIRAENKELKNKIEELSKPKYYTADQLAEMHGVQDLYNEQKWLNDYNTATNQYYDKAVATQQDLRNSYAVNNGQYLDKTLESYMDSYANQTPTATAKGATAANALSTILNAGQTYANDDYNMLQTENLLEEQRKAELANNPNIAKQQYNNIGLMLSQLGTDYYSSAVKEYINQLDAYGSMYAGNRAAEGLANSGTAAKYNGLLNASVKNAAGAASRYNSNKDYYDLYNYGLAINNGNKTAADKFVVNALSTKRINSNK